MTTPAKATPLVCVPDAIPKAQRAGHFALAAKLFHWNSDRREDLPDGYAFRFPATAFDSVAQFVSNERKCCPAITFEIRAESGGPLWLRLTGPEGAREFLAAELQLEQSACCAGSCS